MCSEGGLTFNKVKGYLDKMQFDFAENLTLYLPEGVDLDM